MSSLTLHIVLLFAVAYSQIFGGVSCCCLSRTTIASLNPAHEAASANQDQTPANVPLVRKCPKCAASQPSLARSVNTTGLRDYSVEGSNECQCTKVVSSATVQLEPRSPSIAVQFVATHSANWDIVPRAEPRVFQGYEVPIRFGGSSWQSIACVWKK